MDSLYHPDLPLDGAGHGPVQLTRKRSLYRAVADGYKAFSLVDINLQGQSFALAMRIEVDRIGLIYLRREGKSYRLYITCYR